MNTPKLHLTYALTSLFAKFIFANSFYLYGSPKFSHVRYVYVCVCICECVYMCVYFYNIPVERFSISIVTKISIRNFPIIMPYLCHIVEQPIDRLYCSLLIS